MMRRDWGAPLPLSWFGLSGRRRRSPSAAATRAGAAGALASPALPMMAGRVGRRLFAFGGVLGLAACGFQPTYMRTASGKPGPAQRELAAVYVNLIPDRPGQMLRQALQARFGDDSGTPASYDLTVSFGILGEGIAITQTDLATRLRLTATATYTLVSRGEKPVRLTSGTARAIDGVNVFDSQYFAADLETEARQQTLAEECAQQIANQLATYFREQAAKRVAEG